MASPPPARRLLRAKDLADARYFEPLAGQPDVAIVLMAIPGPPVMDAETAAEVRNLMTKGFAGTVFLTTDDCRASYEELKARGVELSEPPEERPYGIDSSFCDPSGNSIRLTQVREPTTVRWS